MSQPEKAYIKKSDQQRKLTLNANIENDQCLMNMRRKYKRTKSRQATKSICSIETKQSYSLLPPANQIKKRKVQSIPSIDVKHL